MTHYTNLLFSFAEVILRKIKLSFIFNELSTFVSLKQNPRNMFHIEVSAALNLNDSK